MTVEFPAAIVTTWPMTLPGGPTLRIGGLHRALSALGDCRLVPIECNRWQHCRELCQTTGGPAQPCPWDRYFDHAHCAGHGRALAAELHRAGVRTVIFTAHGTYGYVADFASLAQFRVVWDMHNVEAPLARAVATAQLEAGIATTTPTDVAYIEATEAAAIAHADEVWVCSDADRRLLERTYGAGKVTTVVPNVVEVPEIPPQPVVPSRICFTGRLGYFPNTQACHFLADELAPVLTHDLPIVLAGASDALDFEPRSGVELLLDPEDLTSVIAGSIVVVPLWVGGGSRLKILEAFALGAPVVATAKGVEGLDVQPGTHFLPAEEAREFATAIGRLVEEPELRERLVRAGYDFVREHHSTATLQRLLAS